MHQTYILDVDLFLFLCLRGELKLDWEEKHTRTAEKLVDRISRYVQKSHQQAAPAAASSSPSAGKSAASASVVGNPAQALSLQQTLAAQGQHALEVSSLKDQLASADLDFKKQKADLEEKLRCTTRLYNKTESTAKATQARLQQELASAKKELVAQATLQQELKDAQKALASSRKELADHKNETEKLQESLQSEKAESVALREDLAATVEEVKGLKKVLWLLHLNHI